MRCRGRMLRQMVGYWLSSCQSLTMIVRSCWAMEPILWQPTASGVISTIRLSRLPIQRWTLPIPLGARIHSPLARPSLVGTSPMMPTILIRVLSRWMWPAPPNHISIVIPSSQILFILSQRRWMWGEVCGYYIQNLLCSQSLWCLRGYQRFFVSLAIALMDQ